MRRTAAAWALLALLLHPPTAVSQAPRPELEPLAPVETAGLEPRVAEALAAAGARVEELSADPERRDADLALAWGTLGMVHHAHDLLLPARTGYRNASALEPTNPRWPYLLGEVEIELGDAAAADDALARALGLDPANVSILLARSRLRRLEGRTAEAIALARQALEIDGSSLAGRLALAEASLDAGDFGTARSEYEQLLARQPGATKLVTPLASAYRGLGELDRADAILRRRGEVPLAVRDPWLEQVARLRTGAQADLERGSAAAGRGDWPAAAAAFRSAAESDPSNGTAYLNLGAALLQSGEVEGARAALERARELEPSNPSAAQNLAALRGRTGDLEGAAELYREALELAPDRLPARVGLARVLLRSGRAEEALSEFRKALEIRPGDASLLEGELAALQALGRSQELRARLDAALAQRPDDARLLAIAVRLLSSSPLAEVRDGRRAVAIATRLVRASSNVATLELLAMARAEAGEFDAAAATLRAVLGARGLDPATRARLESDLERYLRHEPRRDGGAGSD